MAITPVDTQLTVPYMGVNEFRKTPTWLDSNDLVENGLQAAQDSELNNVLLRASRWAVGYCDQPLHAHTRTENKRARIDKYGRVFIHPDHNPVRAVTGLAYGSDWQNMTVLTDLTQTWVEDNRGLVVSLIPMNASFLGTLQFGTVPTFAGQLYVTYSYVAGYANTYLTAAAAQNDAQLTVADATGFLPPVTSVLGTSIGASVARIWDAGAEEAVTVSSNYVAGNDPVLLSSGLLSAHAASAFGPQVSEIPAEARQAIATYAVALLLRQDASSDGPFAGSPGPAARRSGKGGYSGGLIGEAEKMLEPYKRVR